MTIGGNGAFRGFVMGAGLMMACSLKVMFGGQLIVFRRLFVIVNSLLIFVMRNIGLVWFRRSGVLSRRCYI